MNVFQALLKVIHVFKNKDTVRKHELVFQREMFEYLIAKLPTDEGEDDGIRLAGINMDVELSSDTQLVFHTTFRNADTQDEDFRWTDHTVTAKLNGTDINITVEGPELDEVNAHIIAMFTDCLTSESE